MSSLSSFTQHLNTNFVPTPVETESILRIIDREQLSADAIQAQIAELQGRLRIHTDLIAQHRKLLTPARRIPSDILSSIFALIEKPSSNWVPHPLVAITHVCHLWRDLAINNPVLWTDIDVTVPAHFFLSYTSPDEHRRLVTGWNRNVDIVCEKAEVFAHRAKGCGLRVSLSAMDPSPDIMARWVANPESCGGFERHLQPFIRLAKISTHWQSLKIDLRMYTLLSPMVEVFQRLPGVSMHLQKLDISMHVGQHPNGHDTLWNSAFPEGTVNLNQGRLTVLTARIAFVDLCKLRLTWDTLSKLSLRSSDEEARAYTPQEAASVLSVTSNVEHCTIQFCEDTSESEQFPQQNRIALPKLHTLIMRGSEVPIGFTALLDVPSLKSLSAIYGYGLAPKGENQSAVVELVRRYGEQLTDLSFPFPSVTPLALDLILHSIPNVVSLELVGRNPRSKLKPSSQELRALGTTLRVNVLEKLTPYVPDAEDEGWLCPKLQKLVCNLDAYDSEDEPVKLSIVGLIAVRRSGAKWDVGGSGFAWLRAIHVHFKAGPVDWMVEALREKGVDTEHLEFTAQYPDLDTALNPYAGRITIPGYGSIRVSLNQGDGVVDA